jgi:ribosomal protein L11 methyltransferase
LAEAVEVGALGAEESEGRLCLYVPLAAAEAVRAALAGLAGLAGLRVGPAEAVAERVWSEAWREGLEAIVISPRLLVRPSFRAAPPGFAGAELVIEPGQAFGTGGHASTRLALDALDTLPAEAVAGAHALDVGCGSGVLALAALALGAARALGCDLDPLAPAAAREAAARNGLSARLTLYTGSLAALSPGRDGSFSLILANLLRRELAPLLPRLARLAQPGGRVVLSGLLVAERAEIERALEGAGLRVLAAREASDPSGDAWLALVATRPS